VSGGGPARAGAREILGLFAKAPLPGQVKTRLSPPLSPTECAQLYEAMLLDVIDQHARAGDRDLALWCAPAESAAWFQARVPVGCRVLPQRGTDLGARLAAAFRAHAAEGYGRIAVRGTDSPTLPLERVAAAFAGLERSDLVLCPDRDGGYNLIALRAACDPLFEVELSTESVLEQTRKRALELGLSCTILPPHHDVDVIADLERIRGELSVELTPRTLEWLQHRE
jgi:rSAM/selenodomain-associated transferase 1